jgi:hypothetical protein
MDDLQLLEDLVRDEPLPNRGDLAPARAGLLDAIATAGRPARRRFAFTGLVTTAAAAAAVAVAALAVLNSPAKAPTATPFPSSVSSAPPVSSGSADTFRLVADSAETAQASADRLAAEFGAAVKKTAPEARWIAVPGIYPNAAPPKIKGWDAAGQAKGGQLFNGAGAIQLGGRWGSLALIVDTDTSVLTCPADQPDCVEKAAPNGAKLVVLTITAPAMPTTGSPLTQLQARVALPDDRVLVVVLNNDIGPEGTPRTEWKVPLTLDQVTSIATDIAGKIKP